MNRKKLFCIVGETASGKDSLTKELIKKFDGKLRMVVSYTTRPKREKETDGVEHYFLTEDQFTTLEKNKKSDIIAYTKINGYRYMALSDELEKSNVYIIDPDGIKSLRKKHLTNVEIIACYIYAPVYQRQERALISRNISEEDFMNRVLSEQDQFDKFRSGHFHDYTIDNSDGKFEEALNRLTVIVENHLLNEESNDDLENFLINEYELKTAISCLKTICEDVTFRHINNTIFVTDIQKTKKVCLQLLHSQLDKLKK